MRQNYDLIIVGAGIAGLRVGIEALQRKPGIKCCILEKYSYIGGRVVTFKKDIPKVGKVSWENGAGRISIHHTKVLHLLNQYKLTFIPIGENMNYIDKDNLKLDKNVFTDLIKIYLEPLYNLSEDILCTHTIKELLDKTIGQEKARIFYEQFPYYSEIHVLRADVALKSFKNEMGTNSGFGVCKEGLSSLIDAMVNEFVSRGGTILLDTSVLAVTYQDNSVILDCQKYSQTRVKYFGNIGVLALHSEAIKKIEGVSNLPVLRKLQMTPLLRMYAVFPTARDGVSWFTGLNKIATNSFVRYIIPINSERGIIMISYTDGKDADYWIKLDARKSGRTNVCDLVMSEIRRLFPDRVIPDPLYFKQHPWTYGCTYWMPGKYSVETESSRSLQPLPLHMPNLFMCGESFAESQCWMESALEQADKLLDNNKFKSLLRLC